MKRALLIGANGTIGRALETLMREQYQLETLSRSDTDYSEADLARFAKKLADGQRFSVVICCIGTLHNDIVAPEKRLSELTEEKLAEYFQVNTIIPALCLRFFHKLLDNKSASSYTCLSAMVGSISDNELGGWYGYRSSKAALNMIIKTAAIEVRRFNKYACVAAVHPGTTKGPLSKPYSSGVSKDKYYTPEQSAERILAVVKNLDTSRTGGFLNWDGTTLPW